MYKAAELVAVFEVFILAGCCAIVVEKVTQQPCYHTHCTTSYQAVTLHTSAELRCQDAVTHSVCLHLIAERLSEK